MATPSKPRLRKTHIFAHERHGHYVEPHWVSERLFATQQFTGPVFDPCCGWGTILLAAEQHNLTWFASDIIYRGYPKDKNKFTKLNFLEFDATNKAWRTFKHAGSIVTNPPFHLIEPITQRALAMMRGNSSITRVALLWPLRRLPAARWLVETPLAQILLLTPRPSMPAASHIKRGGPVGGGTQDFCWLIFNKDYSGAPTVAWLRRYQAFVALTNS